MALLYESMHRAMDDSGVPMPFAELYTRDPVATTTPKATYSDPDLDVSHLNTNPLVADAAGYFGPIYAASDEQFYLILTVADGDPTAPYKVYADVTAIGGDAGTSFDRTFASARLKITSGDVDTGISGILIQTGPSSPDDTGGSLLMQGQAGTQGDLAVIDYVETRATGDLDVAGALTVGSSTSFPFLAASGSLASSNVIALSATYDEYMLVLDNLSSTGGVSVRITLSFDGGGTYKTAAGDYTGVSTMISTTTVTAPAATNGYIGIGEQAAATSILYGGAQLRIYSKAGKETTVTGLANLVRTGPIGEQTLLATATNAKGYGKATHIKIEATTTTWSGGRYALFGIPGL